MITKLTAANNELYQARFELMNQAFTKKGLNLEIKSLEEYFANIHTIKQFTESYPEYTGRCLAMPVDEPLFEIDANARTITVPAEFKKNGIAVVGDHLAETVYFKIDKYFDYQSFYDLLQGDDKGKVVINWAFTPTGSKTATEVQSVYAFGPADDLEPGYLIFGWIIDRDMTAASGTLTFSVQFFHDINGEIDYSFNTLTANVAVGNTLKLKAPSEVKDNSTTLGLRLKNSAYRVDAIEGPTEPTWIEDLAEQVNMPFNADDTQSTLTLTAEAGIEKGVTIQYRWFATINGTDAPVELVGTDSYVETNDTAVAEGKLYYKAIMSDETITGYQLLVGDAKEAAFEALGTEEAIAIYERKSSIAVNKAGVYSAQANAKVDISDGTWESLSEADRAQVEALTKSIDSTVCTVPAASEPEVTLEIASNLDPNDIIPTEVTDGKEYVYISDTEAPSITASVVGENLGAFAVVMLDSEGNIVGSDPAINFAELTDADIIAGSVPVDEELVAKYDFARYEDGVEVANSLNAQGQYKVGIINRLNNTYAKGESESIETSFIAPAVTNITVLADDTTRPGESIIMLSNGVSPTAETMAINIRNVSQLTFADNTDYSNYAGCEKAYYLQEVTGTDDMTLVEEEDEAEVELTGSTFMPVDEGYYRIKTVVKYHNTQRTGYTSVFSLYKI